MGHFFAKRPEEKVWALPLENKNTVEEINATEKRF
jgi:hypothetical protein